ncbi:MAG: hypothetical protein ABEH81_01085 [Halopenitus sp.]
MRGFEIGEQNEAALDEFDSFKQWRGVDGERIVIGEPSFSESNLPNGVNRTPPSWAATAEFDNDSEVADSVAKAEPALSYHTFGDYQLEFSDVFDHDELSVKTNEPYRANGAQVESDDASYRATTSGDWVEKFSVTIPEGYIRRVRLDAELKASDDTRIRARWLRDGSTIEEWGEDATEYTAHEHVTEPHDTEGSTQYSIEIRAISDVINQSPQEVRLRDETVTPEFEHDDQVFWLDSVSRTALDPTELEARI